MKHRRSFEKYLFWGLAAGVLLVFTAISYAVIPYMGELLSDDRGWAIAVAVIIVLLIAFSVLIAVFIYKDASARGMNAWLWMITVLFVPNLIGLLLYLFARKQQRFPGDTGFPAHTHGSPKACPHCGKLI